MHRQALHQRPRRLAGQCLFLLILVAASANAAWDLHVTPYFSEFTGFQRLASGPILAGTQGGLFVSLDEGTTWSFTALGSLDDPNAGNDIHFDAVELDDGTVYVVMEHAYRADADLAGFSRVPWPAVLESVEASGDTIWAASTDEIYRSLDRGATWSEVYTVPNNYDDLTRLRRRDGDGALVMELVRPGGPRLVVSTDGGETWSLRSLGFSGTLFDLEFGPDGNLWIGHNYQNRGYLRRSTNLGTSSTVVYTAPSNRLLDDLTFGPASRIAMTQGAGMVISLDGGATFQQPAIDFSHPEPLFFTGGERLLAGTSDGIRISEDQGQTWILVSEGLWANIMIDAEVAPDGTAWVLSSGRLWHDAVGGWQRLDLPGGADQQTHVLSATSSGRMLLLGLESGAPEGFYTDDRGASWHLMSGLDATPSWSRFANVVERGGVLYAGHEGLGLFVSGDDGATWEQRSADPRGHIDVAGDGVLWSSSSQGVRRSDDDGHTWTLLGTSATGPGAASPTGSAFLVPDWSSLNRTTDGGQTWVNVYNNAWLALGDDNLYLTELHAMAYTPDGDLILAVMVENNNTDRRETRLVRSVDDGDTFEDITDASIINRAVVQSLQASAQGMMIACTNQGLYGDQFQQQVGVEELPLSGVTLGRNQPNPFNPRTVIPFAVPRPTHVRLTITDLRGARVATLVDRELPAGSHRAVFEDPRLGSGVYVYRLEVGGQAISGKMTMLK